MNTALIKEDGSPVQILAARGECPEYSRAVATEDELPPGTMKPIKSIYLVEDDHEVREILSSLLDYAGYQVSAFACPVRALEAFRVARPEPDLLLTDYLLGETNGTDLIAEVRALQPNIRTILISGHAHLISWDREPARPDQLLQKPVRLEVLLEHIRQLENAYH